MELTAGLIIFATGLGGMVLILIVGVISIFAMGNSKKKLQRKLDEVYKL